MDTYLRAYLNGKATYRRRPDGQCNPPYPANTRQHEEFAEGWWEARQEDGKHPTTYGKDNSK